MNSQYIPEDIQKWIANEEPLVNRNAEYENGHSEGWRAGAIAMYVRNASQVGPVSGWFKIEDGKGPEEYKKVLLYWDGLMEADTGYLINGSWVNSYKEPHWALPSHWMPLPPKPGQSSMPVSASIPNKKIPSLDFEGYDPIVCDHKRPEGFTYWHLLSGSEGGGPDHDHGVYVQFCEKCGEVRIFGQRTQGEHRNSFDETTTIYLPEAVAAIIKTCNWFCRDDKDFDHFIRISDVGSLQAELKATAKAREKERVLLQEAVDEIREAMHFIGGPCPTYNILNATRNKITLFLQQSQNK